MSVPILNYPIAGRRASAIAGSVEASIRAGRLAPGKGQPLIDQADRIIDAILGR